MRNATISSSILSSIDASTLHLVTGGRSFGSGSAVRNVNHGVMDDPMAHPATFTKPESSDLLSSPLGSGLRDLLSQSQVQTAAPQT